MPEPTRTVSAVVRLFTVALLTAWLGLARAGAEDVVPISNSHHEPLSPATVRAIFAMRIRQWPDDRTAITVFVLRASDPSHAVFCKKVLDVFPYQLQQVWDRLIFSGTGQAPIELNSMDQMKRRVASTPGAIGYITTDRLDERVHPLRLQ